LAKRHTATKSKKAAYWESKRQELTKAAEDFISDALSFERSPLEILSTLEAIRRLSCEKRYSWANIGLLLSQLPGLTRTEQGLMMQTYDGWVERGRQVRKGAKQLFVWAPRLVKREVEDPVSGQKEERQVLVGFYLLNTRRFDVSQTYCIPCFEAGLGELVQCAEHPIPTLLKATLDDQGLLDRLLDVVDVPVRFADISWVAGAGCGGYTDGKEIVVNDGYPAGSQARTLIHEWGHILCRHFDEDRKESDRPIRELEAELTSFLVSRHFGLETDARAYVAGWLERRTPEHTAEVLDASIAKAVRAANRIIEAVERAGDDDTEAVDEVEDLAAV